MSSKIDRYTYWVTWSEEDAEYVALCAEFPSLSWLAPTPEDALKGMHKVVAEVIANLATNEEPVPEPISTKRFSGKLMVRVPSDDLSLEQRLVQFDPSRHSGEVMAVEPLGAEKADIGGNMPRTTPAACAQRTLDQAEILTKGVVNTATYLDIPKNKLAHILGVSGATVTRLYAGAYRLSPDKKEWDFAVLLVRLFRSLDSIVGGSANDARKWLNGENAALSGKKPADLIDTKEGIVRVVTYLEACRAVA